MIHGGAWCPLTSAIGQGGYQVATWLHSSSLPADPHARAGVQTCIMHA
jgi:hypothetical protein